MRLVVVLHGASGRADGALQLLQQQAAEHRLMLAAPEATSRTWDVLTDGHGPEVRRIEKLLQRLSGDHPVDSYTDAARVRNGDPRLFISHGSEDEVLPIDLDEPVRERPRWKRATRS